MKTIFSDWRKASLSIVAASALLVGGVATAPPAAAAGSATTVTRAINATTVMTAQNSTTRIDVSPARKRTLTKPFRFKESLRIPVLKGSTAKNRKLFAGHVNAMVAAEKKSVSKWRSGFSGCNFDAYMGSSVSASIYKSRYASVIMTFGTDPGCGGVAHSNPRSFTLDLKTGKKLGISTFLAQDDPTTKLATVTNFAAKNRCIDTTSWDPLATKTSESGWTQPIPRPKAWSVSSQGVRVAYEKYTIAAGACGAPAVVLPWAEVAPAKSMAGTVKSRVYVSNFTWNKRWGTYDGDVAILSAQGRKVGFLKGSLLGQEASFCGLGVRSGRTATLVEPYGSKKVKIQLADSSSNPKLAKPSLGKGMRLATTKEIQVVKSYVGSTNAIRMCS